MPPAPSRTFCATCGWPLAGPRCEACGGDAVPLPLQDAATRFTPRDPHAPGGLEKANEAWQKQDYTRAFSHVIGALGIASRSAAVPDGPAWVLVEGRTALFVCLRPPQITIDSPLCRLPQRQRAAALRFALEVSGAELATSRVCLRGDLLVLRHVARRAGQSPARGGLALREACARAEQYTNALASAFDARTALGAEELASAGWEAVGAGRPLAPLAAPEAIRSVPPPPPSSRTPRPVSIPRATPADGIGAAKAPLKIPTPAPAADQGGDIPAILAPAFAAGGAALAAPPLPQFSKRKPTLHEIQVEATPSKRTASMPPPPPAAEGTSDTDRLCELLRYAQALATALSFQERPATMMLLVRATVYRAVYDFGESVPDAVAYLFRATAASTKEIWQSSSDGRRRSSMSLPIPIAEPALLVMERIVSSRANVGKEKPPAIEPLTSAAQAKEHLGRYVEEIERAPQDAPLVHFLALGALSELLARTKLPPQTQQRLREIVAHAQRDGARAPTNELMLTALKRIVAG